MSAPRDTELDALVEAIAQERRVRGETHHEPEDGALAMRLLDALRGGGWRITSLRIPNLDEEREAMARAVLRAGHARGEEEDWLQRFGAGYAGDILTALRTEGWRLVSPVSPTTRRLLVHCRDVGDWTRNAGVPIHESTIVDAERRGWVQRDKGGAAVRITDAGRAMLER